MPSPSPVQKASAENTLGSYSLSPILLWFDKSSHERKTTEKIKGNHPELEIKFLPTYTEAVEYLNQQAHDLKRRIKTIVIFRPYYKVEKKTFIDILQILNNAVLEELSMAVYTDSKKTLLEKTPDLPKNVEIFDKTNDLLDFVDKNLK